MPTIHPDMKAYNAAQSPADKKICDQFAKLIGAHFAEVEGSESKVWHRHPVWFINGNPIVGYSKLKDCLRLLFWSGQSFDEPGLLPAPPDTKFKSADARYTSAAEINTKDLKRWLKKSVHLQWDYKNIVKRKGKLVRLK